MGEQGRLRARLIALVATLVLLGAACGGDTDDQQAGNGQIPIGLLSDLSGPFKSFGVDIEAAVELAVEEINEEGDTQFRVIVRDTGGDPQQAVVELRDLASQEDVFATIGPVSSGEAEVVFTQAARLSIPILTGTANKEGITELGEGWAFRNQATNTQLYQSSMSVYKERFDVSRVALIYDEKQAVAAAAAEISMPAVAEQVGIDITEQFTVQTGQTDFTSVVQRVKGVEGIDGLFVVTTPIEGGFIAKELDRQGITLPVLGHPAQNSGAFTEAGGEAIQDWVVPSIFNPEAEDDRTQQFVQAMAERDNEPPTVPESANYYDIVYMLAEVIEQENLKPGTNSEQARNVIQEGLGGLEDFRGIGGTISFLENGDVKRPVYTLVLSGDEARVLTE